MIFLDSPLFALQYFDGEGKLGATLSYCILHEEADFVLFVTIAFPNYLFL